MDMRCRGDRYVDVFYRLFIISCFKWDRDTYKRSWEMAKVLLDAVYVLGANGDSDGIRDIFRGGMKVNSIKLTYDQYEQFESENNLNYFGSKPITLKIREAGINPDAINFYMRNTGTGYILSNAPLESLELEGEAAQRLLKAMDKRVKGPDFPEVMNIFNELLGDWALDAKIILSFNPGTKIEHSLEIKKINEKRDEYERKFKEALGVE